MESAAIKEPLENLRNAVKGGGRWRKFRTLAERYHNDASLRARIDSGDVSEAIEYLGIAPADKGEIRVVADTPDLLHFVMPRPVRDSDLRLPDETLSGIAGGGGHCAGTGACASTAGSMACSTVPSSASSGGSVSTVGSASCSDD